MGLGLTSAWASGGYGLGRTDPGCWVADGADGTDGSRAGRVTGGSPGGQGRGS